MEQPLGIDRSRAALLIMDYQTAVLDHAPGAEALLQRAASVLAHARLIGMRVIYITVGFRPGFPEISPRNPAFSAIKQSGRFLSGDGGGIHAAIPPQAGDVTVVKHRVSAFAGTDLDIILRAQDVDTLLLMGVATSGVVLSTVRHAADADYRLVVIEDCCADRDPEVHRLLLDKVFPRQATVVSAQDFIDGFGA